MIRHLSLNVASQFVAIGAPIHRDSGSTDFVRTFGVVPPVILTKLQRRLLIKPVRKFQCKGIKKTSRYLWTVGGTIAVDIE